MADQTRCPEGPSTGYGKHVSEGGPENKLGITAGLIDRAVDEVPASHAGPGSRRIVRVIVERVAPLLIEHGRQQERNRTEAEFMDLAAAEKLGVNNEREKWKARIEKLAAQYERWGADPTPAGGHEGDEYQRGCDETCGRAGRDLRSLLTGEGENGE